MSFKGNNVSLCTQKEQIDRVNVSFVVKTLFFDEFLEVLDTLAAILYVK